MPARLLRPVSKQRVSVAEPKMSQSRQVLLVLQKSGPIELAGRTRWQTLNNVNGFGNFIRAIWDCAWHHSIRLSASDARVGHHHESLSPLTPFRIWHAHDSDLPHSRVLHQACFDILGLNLHTARIDDMVSPADDDQLLIKGQIACIAAPPPAVMKSCCGALLVFPVTRRQRSAPQKNFTDFTVGKETSVLPVSAMMRTPTCASGCPAACPVPFRKASSSSTTPHPQAPPSKDKLLARACLCGGGHDGHQCDLPPRPT